MAGIGDPVVGSLRGCQDRMGIIARAESRETPGCTGAGRMELYDADDKAKAFYRELSDTDFQKIRVIVERLLNWPLWSSPENSEIDNYLSGNKSALKDWFRSKGLRAEYLLGVSG